ncbi:hypothetical protein GCM10010124_37010 [Pilimelia terevasa]|uniref:TIR domain-containing protein n=1 Tax=Pilimelia terevasa TaxID=53372 RepID=A0A8J3BUR8_9ACTN|nr:TIR domain-containing protein [Pilimelia terevasa]GGK40765.1 hypothetical protein GCM10010124_37010 [Pilimelia terevasa]
MPSIFINYRSCDETYAAILLDEKLCGRFGREHVFRDNRSILLGKNYKPVLWGSLAKSSVLIVVIGPKWRGEQPDGTAKIDDPDDFVRREIELALQIGIRVVPVLVGDVPNLAAAKLPPSLAALADCQYTRLGNRGAQHDVARLVDELARSFGTSDRPDEPPDGAAAAVNGAVAAVQLARADATVGERINRRSLLRNALAEAVAEARLGAVEFDERRAGYTVVMGTAVPPARVIASFPRALNAALTERNSTLGPLWKVKVGVHPDSVEGAEAIASIPVLDDVLRQASRAHVALAVPDRLYREVVEAHARVIDPSTFGEAVSGGMACWIHVPDYPSPPRVPGIRSNESTVRDAPSPPPIGGPVFHVHGDFHGRQIAGDHVGRDVNYYGDGYRR